MSTALSRITCPLVFSLSCLPIYSYSSGFAIIEHSASGLAQSFAGASAVAEDASTVFFNPAGMNYLEGTQLSMGLHLIKPSAKYSDTSSSANFAGLVDVALGNDYGGDAGGVNFVPNAYYVRKIGSNSRFGLGINSPVGLNTTYNEQWIGRYASTESDLKTININPSFSTQLSPQFQLGIGVSAQYIKATLKNNSYFCGHPQLTPTCNPTDAAQILASDLKTTMQGDDWSYGFNLGLIFSPNSASRFGLAYRSKVRHSLKGQLKAVAANGAAIISSDISAGVDLPESVSLSAVFDLDPQWSLLTDITYTGWSSFQELKVIMADGSTDITPENWSNSMRYSLGARYRLSSAVTLRAGVAVDRTPIDNAYRTSRIPGDNRRWLSFGASFAMTKDLSIDVGYAHLWVDHALINESFDGLNGAMQGRLVGHYSSSVDILSAQLNWKF